MKKQRVPLYLAHASYFPEPQESPDDPSEENIYLPGSLKPQEAAGYIAELLASLRSVAVTAQLDILSDLIEVAQEEAKMHCRR